MFVLLATPDALLTVLHPEGYGMLSDVARTVWADLVIRQLEKYRQRLSIG